MVYGSSMETKHIFKFRVKTCNCIKNNQSVDEICITSGINTFALKKMYIVS